ncbi:tail length tape measure protein [Mycobacterium phage MooMoo]|uniref:Tape measure protein n=1 Tax=Mycobacterium phage MooMoo TaxID=2108127 RepID=A0A2P1JR57_9CAUD|nr:tail length tape measure protein [Mycobacterium phage MooMoo]AVO21620.1 tape measure protein [Mycobacterium phage MooMoo]
MGIPIPVETTLDERTATAAARKAEKFFADAGKNAGQQFSDAFTGGARDVDQAVKKVADKASDAYDKARDAAGKLRVETEKLDKLQQEGAGNDRIVAQAERVEKARRDEARAVRNAADAYKDYEQAAKSAGENAGDNFSGGFRGSIAGMTTAGQDAAGEFAGGFASSSALLRLGSAGGPIGLALAGVATLGVMGGKLLADGIAEGLQTLQVQDVIATRMGVDNGTMKGYGNAAGQAFANGWGESFEGNLKTLQVGVQSGLISPDISQDEAQKFIERMQSVSATIEEDPAQIARGTRNFVKTGLAKDYEEAFDLIVASTQKGLNISNDLLDTFEEYGTKFRDLGLSGQEALGLINQMWEGGARNVDVAADALKEFAISVTDSSDTTKTALTALGFDADDLAEKFAQGGPSARAAFGTVLEALGSISDPMEKERIGLDLFKTKWEDVGDAINNLDLPGAASELGNIAGKTDEASEALSRHQNQWGNLKNSIDDTFRKFKEWLADSAIGRFFNESLPAWLNNTITGDNQQPAGAVPHDIPAPPAPAGIPADQQAGIDAGQRARNGTPAPPPPGIPQDQLAGIDAGQRARNGQPAPPPPGAPAPPPDIARGPGMSYDAAAKQVADEKKAASAAEKAKPSFDPSQYSVDAIPVPGSIPGAIPGVVPGVPGAPPPGVTGPGAYQVDPQRVFDAETSVMSARNSVESARIRVLELEASGTATQQELNQARTQVTMAERQYVSAQSKLLEAQQGTWKKMEDTAKQFSQGMGEIGAALDNDLGISKGLPGLAENLVKFVASLGAAPILGQLDAISRANPIQGGHGLLGILGAQGAFGPQYTQSQYAQQGYVGYGSGAPGYASAANPAVASMLALAQGANGGSYSWGGSDLSRGLADCSGAVSDLVEVLQQGGATPDRLFNTEDFAAYAQSHGWQRGLMPGALNVGVKHGGRGGGHMAATLPNGVNFESGGAHGGIAYGGPAAGAGDKQFTEHWYLPVGGAPTAAAAPSVAATAVPATAPSGTPAPSTAGVIPDSVLYAPQNTNPALTPAASTAAPGIPAPVGGGAPLAFGQGAPQAAPFAQNSQYGGAAFPAQGGGGFQGLGGAPMDALMMATQGLDLLAPGASQAAQIGIKLANRAIGYAGQLAGIGVSGLMETFLPAGSPLASIGNSWFGKVASGFAGARPALPNAAGQKAPTNPAQANPQQPQGGPSVGTNIEKLEFNNNEATQGNGVNDLTRNLEAQHAPTGQR